MKCFHQALILIAAMVPINHVVAVAGEGEMKAFTPLFNGRDLAGWTQPRGRGPKYEWTVRDSGLYCLSSMKGPHYDLVCDIVLPENCALKFSWKAEVGQNVDADAILNLQESFRQSVDLSKKPEKTLYYLTSGVSYSAGGNIVQLETIPIVVEEVKQSEREGKTIGRAPVGNYSRPPGEWNQGEVVVRDGLVEFKVNGKTSLRIDLSDDQERSRFDDDGLIAATWLKRKRAGVKLSLMPLGVRTEYKDIEFKELSSLKH